MTENAPYSGRPSLQAAIEDVPKVELHLHLEGSLRPATLAKLAGRHGVDVPRSRTRPAGYGGFARFAEAFLFGLDLLRTEADFLDTIDALVDELVDQRVRYAEVTTTPFLHLQRGLPLPQYVAALNRGRRRAAARGLALGWILDIPRGMEDPGSTVTLDLAAGGQVEGTVALGLGGPEQGFSPRLYSAAFVSAERVGLGRVPHAGETDGAHAVWSAIRDLAAQRIGHGVRSVEDPALIQHLRDTQTPLEISITSNVCLAVVAAADAHPIRQLAEEGVRLTINSDDPAYFATTLTKELHLAANLLRLDVAGVIALQRTAADASFMSDELRDQYLGELARFSDRHDQP